MRQGAENPHQCLASAVRLSALIFSLALTLAAVVCAPSTACAANSLADTQRDSRSSSGNLATSVPTPTYPLGGVRLSQFEELNAIRLAGNFGMLAQDPALDQSATNHARYLIANYYSTAAGWNSAAMTARDPSTSYLTSHVEYNNLPGFNGSLPVDRVTAVGGTYAGVGEVVAPQSLDCVGKLLNSVFHRVGLLGTDMQQIGIDIVATPNHDSNICVMDFGYKNNPGITPSGWLGLYPNNGQTNVPTGMFSAEAPDPAPNVPVTQRGYPISIFANQAIATVNSFTLTAGGAGSTVPAILITKADFPGFLPDKVAFILPTQLLAPDTAYTVQFNGVLADGSTLEKTWSFSTTTRQPIVINFSPATLDGPGSSIVATANGAERFDYLWIGAYATYDVYPGAPATPAFITTTYTNAEAGFHAITITRTNTPCEDKFVHCAVVVFAQDLLGNRVQTTLPFQ